MIVVTGANGQVGTELRARLGASAVYLDRGALDLDAPGDVAALLETHHCTVLINAAGYTQVDKAETDAATAFRANAETPGLLARAARERGAAFVHFSTDYVFSGEANTPYRESDDTGPMGVYGASKLAGEERVLEAHPQALVLRTSWVYAAHGKNFIRTILKAGNERDELRVVYDQVGAPTWAGDVADFALRGHAAGLQGVHHFSAEGVTSWYDVAEYLRQKCGLRARVTPIRSVEYPTPARRPAYSVLDKTKLKTALGTTIPHWTESLDHVLHQLEAGQP